MSGFRKDFDATDSDATNTQKLRIRTANDGGGLSRMAASSAGVVVGAATAAKISLENSAYQATRNSKLVLCPNPFMKPEQVIQDHKLERGDVIEFLRPNYQHYGIYVGDGKIVHLTNQGYVQQEDLAKVADGMECRVNNLEPFAERRGLIMTELSKFKENAVNKAMNHVSPNKRIQYNVADYNCEHFVTECIYGRAFSEQEDTLKTHGLALRFAKGIAKISQYE